MTTQYGPPLTGVQMKLLRDAGLPDDPWVSALGFSCNFSKLFIVADEIYQLADSTHVAYTLAKAGWLDGRNVALWFGGDEAPEDWDEGSSVLFRNGVISFPAKKWSWKHKDDGGDIIAYTRKTEYREETVNACQSFDETITIPKMTEAEVSEIVLSHHMTTEEIWGAVKFCRLMGLVEPVLTREERFWAAQPNGCAHVTDDVKAWVLEALYFERN